MEVPDRTSFANDVVWRTIADGFYDVYVVLYDGLSCHSIEGWYGRRLARFDRLPLLGPRTGEGIPGV